MIIAPRSHFLAVAAVVLMSGTVIAAPVPITDLTDEEVAHILRCPPTPDPKTGGHQLAGEAARATAKANQKGVVEYQALKDDHPEHTQFANKMMKLHGATEADAKIVEGKHQNHKPIAPRPKESMKTSRSATTTAKDAIIFATMLRTENEKRKRN